MSFATEHLNYIPGLVAGEDLTAAKYHIVKLQPDADNVVLKASAATQILLGVLCNAPDDERAANVAGVGSLAPCIAGEEIPYAGMPITVNGVGQGVVATSGNSIVGIAVTRAAALGDLFVVYVLPQVASGEVT